jgi:hypothetical protein
MTTIEQAMEALADAFAGIDGLSRYPRPPSSVEVPAVVVSLPAGELGDYSPVMGQDCMDLTLVVNVFVQWGDDEAAWTELQPFVDRAGASSLFAAVNADPTLGGVVDSALPFNPTNFGPYTYGAVQYLGAEMTVEVLM